MSQPSKPEDSDAANSAQTPEEPRADSPEMQIQQLRAELEQARAELSVEQERHRKSVALVEQKRRRLTLALAVVLLILITGAAVGALWYQQKRAEDQLRQHRVEQEISTALHQASALRSELHAQLNESGKVFQLLNESSLWHGAINQSRILVQRAAVLAKTAGNGISEGLKTRIRTLQNAIQQDELDFNLAIVLDRIRTSKATSIDGKFEISVSAQQYATAFENVGLTFDRKKPKKSVALIRESAIKELLLAALDDWATAAMKDGQGKSVSVLLQWARLADPDPWKNRLRNAGVWKDRKELEQLLKSAPVEELPPQTLYVLGAVLRNAGIDAEPLLRQAAVYHPMDFSLHFKLGNLLSKAKPAEAAGYYRAALAIRPTAPAVWNNLGTALNHQGSLLQAIESYKKAIEVDPNLAVAWSNLGSALLDRNDTIGAAAALQTAGSKAEVQGKLDFALTSLRKAMKLESQNKNETLSGSRFLAACVALQRAAGKGNDAAKLKESSKKQLRDEALKWLRIDLAGWTYQINNGTNKDREQAKRAMLTWQSDYRLASVRDAQLINKLPLTERQEWTKMWADVELLLRRVN